MGEIGFEERGLSAEMASATGDRRQATSDKRQATSDKTKMTTAIARQAEFRVA
jgi:hypothetical protein